MKAIKVLSIVLFIIFVSCEQKRNSYNESGETTTMTDEAKKKEIERLERLQSLDNIFKQFGASITFDTAKYKMTYQYQNLLQLNNRVVIEKFKITDIEKIDSNYLVSIENGFRSRKFIKFICNQDQMERIFPDIKKSKINSTRINDKFLILKINSIKKVKFKLDSYGELNGDDEPTTHIELEISNAYICTGEFIDIYLKSKR